MSGQGVAGKAARDGLRFRGRGKGEDHGIPLSAAPKEDFSLTRFRREATVEISAEDRRGNEHEAGTEARCKQTKLRNR